MSDLVRIGQIGLGRFGSGYHLRNLLAIDAGVTINGLTILNEYPSLNFYFENVVVGGAGAFVRTLQLHHLE